MFIQALYFGSALSKDLKDQTKKYLVNRGISFPGSDLYYITRKYADETRNGTKMKGPVRSWLS